MGRPTPLPADLAACHFCEQVRQQQPQLRALVAHAR
jgi:hypothetical protein